MIDPTSAILCLALNVYHEARGEPLKGQQAVAHVTLNRARKQSKRICDVVFAPYQFSWTDSDPKVKNEKAWQRSLKVAKAAFYGGRKADPTGGATHFHTPDVNPSWNRDMHVVAQIGFHIFYLEQRPT